MVKSYFLYNVSNKCLFTSGEIDTVNYFVWALTESKALKRAKEYLESGNTNNGWKIKEVIGQKIELSSCFLADDSSVLN